MGPDVLGHGVDGVGQRFEFLARIEADAFVVFSGPDGLGRARELGNGGGHAPGHEEPYAHGNGENKGQKTQEARCHGFLARLDCGDRHGKAQHARRHPSQTGSLARHVEEILAQGVAVAHAAANLPGKRGDHLGAFAVVLQGVELLKGDLGIGKDNAIHNIRDPCVYAMAQFGRPGVECLPVGKAMFPRSQPRDQVKVAYRRLAGFLHEVFADGLAIVREDRDQGEKQQEPDGQEQACAKGKLVHEGILRKGWLLDPVQTPRRRGEAGVVCSIRLVFHDCEN